MLEVGLEADGYNGHSWKVILTFQVYRDKVFTIEGECHSIWVMTMYDCAGFRVMAIDGTMGMLIKRSSRNRLVVHGAMDQVTAFQ